MMNILEKLKIIQFSFILPKKNNILIYDKKSEKILKNVIKNSYNVIHTRLEKINIQLLIYSIINNLNKTFYKGIYFNYIKTLIEYHNPKKIITTIDNDIRFYKLKRYFQNTKFISIQNGYRVYKDDLFELLDNTKEKLYCDEYYCFGQNIKNYLKNRLKSKYFILGSIKNNFSKKISFKKNKDICFISSYGSVVSNLKNEKKIINILLEFCLEKNIKLTILPRTMKKEEKTFYQNIIKNDNFIYHKKKKKINYSYNLIDKYEICVSLNSTLGYENLARGNKTLFINTRDADCKSFMKFGYPEKFKEEGQFWISVSNKDLILKKIRKIYKLSNNEWKRKSKKIFDKIIVFNKNNNLLIKNINN